MPEGGVAALQVRERERERERERDEREREREIVGCVGGLGGGGHSYSIFIIENETIGIRHFPP